MKKNTLIFALTIFGVVLIIGCTQKGDNIQTAGTANQNNNSTAAFMDIHGDTGADDNTDTWASDTTGQNTTTTSTDFPPELLAYFQNAEIGPNVNPIKKFIGNQANFPPPPFKADIDFTTFNGEEFDDHFADIMFINPDDYLGKTIRLIGPYTGNFFEDSGRYYHFVLIDDVTGCCLRYVELELPENITPDKFPANFSIIDVSGVFGSYYDPVVDWNFNRINVSSISNL